MINVVESDYFLIEFKEVDLVGHHGLDLLLVLAIDHLDPRLREVVSHRQLRVPIEADILLIVTLVVHVLQEVVPLSISVDARLAHESLRLPSLIEHLLEQQLVDFDVAVVHNQVFSHEIFESLAVDDVELTVALKAVDHCIDALFKLIPILFVFLNFRLSPRQILIKLLKVIVIVHFLELILLRDLAKLGQDLHAELPCFFRELLLHLE